MKIKSFIITGYIFIILTLQVSDSFADIRQALSLDKFAGVWMKMDSLKSYPSVNNFHGGLQINKDLLSISYLTFPPFSQGHHSGHLSINGKTYNADFSRWYPYQAQRKKLINGVEVISSIRMIFEDKGVLFRIVLQNTSNKNKIMNIRAQLLGKVRKFDAKWEWGCPRPQNNDDQFKVYVKKRKSILIFKDINTTSYVTFSFNKKPDKLGIEGSSGFADWKVMLKPSGKYTIDYVMAVGDMEYKVINSSKIWSKNFNKFWHEAKEKWQQRFNKAFTPNNKHFSGNLPLLITSDKKLHRVYYMSILSLLQLYRTNYPISNRVFATVGPRYGTTLMYFWDTGMWPTVWCLLDPVSAKEHLKRWISLDYHNCYAVDYISGDCVGPWYASNDLMIFKSLETYVRVTGDVGFLNESVAGKTVLEHMDSLALYWKNLVRPNTELADYGEAKNLLECVPTYKNQVPSLNAGNVWMMRHLASFYESYGNKIHSEQLRTEANELAKIILKLYAPGEGVWHSIHRNGDKVKIRHIYDFISIGKTMTSDLTPEIRKQMVLFTEKELLTPKWIRALSLKYETSKDSLRPDHGSTGSYDGWVALMIDVMAKFGYFDKCLYLISISESVTYEGPFSQSHEILKLRGELITRIASQGGQDYNESCGAAFADVIIHSLFGFSPSISSKKMLTSPTISRNFNGKLVHLRFGKNYYTINSNKDGLTIDKESNL